MSGDGMTTYSVADWAGIGGFFALVGAVLAPFTVGVVWLPVTLAVAALLFGFAVPRWRRQALATRRSREIAARRANIHTLETDLGFEPIRWDD